MFILLSLFSRMTAAFKPCLCIVDRQYFEAKAQFNKTLEEQKLRVKELEKKVSDAKASYAQALRNLEEISDEIHRVRYFN